MPTKVLFGGCGLTGTATSWFIQRAMQAEISSHTINTAPIFRFIDQAQHLGGRFSTHHFTDSKWTLEGQVDAGGQYLTRYGDRHASIFDYLHHTGVIHPFDASSGIIQGVKSDYTHLPHYLAPKGMSEIVKAFLTTEETQQVRLSTSIRAINIQDDGKLYVTCDSQDGFNTYIEQVDCLVLSMPAPALSRITGNIWSNIAQIPASATHPDGSSILKALENVQYSARYALAAYSLVSSSEYERIFSSTSEDVASNWRAKYVFDDPYIRYISLENFKHASSQDMCLSHDHDQKLVSILLHSSLPFYAEQRSKQASDSEISDLLLTSLHRQLPWTIKHPPIATKLIPWTISQCTKPFNLGTSGAAIGVDVGQSRIVFAGDYFSTSNFEGCLDSAQDAAAHVMQLLQSRQS